MFKRFVLLLSVLFIALSSVALADVDINSSIDKVETLLGVTSFSHKAEKRL